jgi:hypothetical protein
MSDDPSHALSVQAVSRLPRFKSSRIRKSKAEPERGAWRCPVEHNGRALGRPRRAGRLAAPTGNGEGGGLCIVVRSWVSPNGCALNRSTQRHWRTPLMVSSIRASVEGVY